jgi:hypothetical protein
MSPNAADKPQARSVAGFIRWLSDRLLVQAEAIHLHCAIH